MGQRANLIIMENNTYSIYYDHWAANSLDSYLFWGPEKAITFFRDHEKSGAEYWLDTVWCEGGAVIDLDLNVLIFFGGEDIKYDIPLRNMYLKLLRIMWSGYLVKWGFNGVLDLAAYVGYSAVDQLGEPMHSYDKSNWEDSFTEAVGRELEGALSVTSHETLKIHPIFGYDAGSKLLFAGERIVENVEQQAGCLEFSFPDLSTETYTDFARQGLHLDLDNHMLFFWMDRPLAVFESQLQPLWPTWTIVNLWDDYRKHELLTQNRLTYLGSEENRLINQIRTIVCRPYKSEVNAADKLISTLEEDGKTVEVNPLVHATSLFDMPVDLRLQIFDKVIVKAGL